MKVINPMETIRENQLFERHSSTLQLPGVQSKMTSTVASPVSSPNHGRRNATSNLLAHLNLRSQLSLSKSTLDGLKFQATQDKINENNVKPLMQTLVGTTVIPKAPSYIDGWLHQEPGSRFDISAVQARLPSPLTHHKNLNNYMAREGQVATPVGQCEVDYTQSETSSMLSSEKRESTVHSPSVVLNMEGIDEQPTDPVDLEPSPPTSTPVAASTDHPETSKEPVSHSGSENSLLESNQSTVNSLTPLLKSEVVPNQTC